MGKAGNKARREAKKARESDKLVSLNDKIQEALSLDEAERDELDNATENYIANAYENLSPEEYQTAFEKVFGKPGPNNNVVWLGAPNQPTPPKVQPPLALPPPQTKKILDCLGRVKEVPVTNDLFDVEKAIADMVKPKHDTTPAREGKRRVTIMRDHALDYPELWIEVFVSPDPAVRDDEARFAHMFSRARCSRAKSVLESDLVVFGGGSDVNPALYGEKPHPTTHFNTKRDDDDMALYMMCLEEGIPMLGICRGAQFLHVMNGGKLYQDIDNHYGNHNMFDIHRKEMIDKVSSVHHQACIANSQNGMQLLATSGAARNRARNPIKADNVIGPRADVEAFYYRDTCCIGVQGHPEYQGYNYFTKWVLDQINELVLLSPDIEWRDKNRRVRQELLDERKHRAAPLIIPSNVTPATGE